MFFTALFIICSISPINGWRGDWETGPSCVAIQKNFELLGDCKKFLYETEKQVNTPEEYKTLTRRLKPPYNFEGVCKMTVNTGHLEK